MPCACWPCPAGLDCITALRAPAIRTLVEGDRIAFSAPRRGGTILDRDRATTCWPKPQGPAAVHANVGIDEGQVLTLSVGCPALHRALRRCFGPRALPSCTCFFSACTGLRARS